jgi:hypothetical protein
VKRQISHTIEIAASPAEVWAVVSDTAAFPTWNPFIRKLEGKLQTGAKLSVTIEPPGRRSTNFRPTVLAAQPGRELRWLGRILIPGVFDGEHSLVLEPTATGGTRFTQGERFSGILVRLFSANLDSTEVGFKQMNEALKARAEGAVDGSRRA